MRQYTLATLNCGLRCVHSHASGLAEVCGVIVDAGSRDEGPAEEGLAHFVEHTIFKGTTHRRAWHIINSMESVGGELNAYTTKENTTVYSIFPRGNAHRALDMIADLICSSTFPDAELTKEREVVIDEIESYHDMPAERIWDDIDELAFTGNSLSHNILGSPDSLSRLGTGDCKKWLSRHYTPSRMVLFYTGHLSAPRFFAMAEHLFASLRPDATHTPRRKPLFPQPCAEVRDHGNHQAHTIMASRIDDDMCMYDSRRHALALLTNMIGGPGMNSQLNVALRERRGLVYTVESSLTLYTDSALWATYFGCDSGDNERCMDLVRRTLRDVASTMLTPSKLNRIKRQYLGQLSISSESKESCSLAMGRQTLYHGFPATTDDTRKVIESVTSQDLVEIARILNPDNMVCLTLE